MIQRIQSLYLLVVAILMAITVFSPLFRFVSDGNEMVFTSFGVNEYKTWGVVSIASITSLVALINIFLFKKRKLQLKLCTLISLLIIFFYTTVFVYYNTYSTKHEVIFDNISYGIILPLIALIFNLLAIFSIKKDEKLVRSLDRIR